MATRPGYAIKDYLEGKRINHFKPFSFIIILGAIYGFIVHFFNIYPEAHVFGSETDIATNNNKVLFEWMYAHYSLVMFIMIPVSALSSYLTFRKDGYNYMEHIIIYSYISGMHILILLVSYPVYYLTMSSVVYIINFIALTAYNIWVLAQLFRKTSWTKVVVKALFSILLSNVMIFVLTIIVFVVIVVFNIYVPQ